MSSASTQGPHARIETDSPRHRFALRLFDRLWARYRERVSYVADYEKVVADAGAQFVNDHIAFRTLACQTPAVGLFALARIFEALDYRPAGCYFFPDKRLTAMHYAHPHPQFPKLFLSELHVWELTPGVRELIYCTAASHRPLVSDELLSQLTGLEEDDPSEATLLDTVVDTFHTLPWRPPTPAVVEAVNAESQYAAWVLAHGYNVNHFTALINSHQVASLDSIEKTIAALQAAGVPMKSEIEGKPGSKLRQTATAAVEIDVPLEGGDLPWSYAYFELAERNDWTDPETGETARFEGFLGPQATQLFEMTRRPESGK
ncbi:DUF1338 domain-containing protein [Lignipirellula cremea]|uniref:2-oxoadipate dioxygenase/decarboxylase n=1 Tax=Lignipirellula cremea TaxID=2528010 RepID=A0A518DS51_9BACT|nr:DUF1338 domain-containing protein [Lignipirellula cremea]QDU94659.1 hypothetical protein Pla8534_24650 [Lignipirellula cremea]